jgi:transcriptional regulator with XRE-family HTH domain
MIACMAADIGVRIARRRQQLRMTQEELAVRLGVSKSTVANWETGKHFPKRKLGAIEAELGISLNGQPEPSALIAPEVEEAVRLHAESPEEADALLAAMRERKLSRLRNGRSGEPAA